MVFFQNCGVISSLFILLFKIVCEFIEYYCPMYNKRSTTLTSIPEKAECEDTKKWVPKNKHEVLKAKYKCLKKLFQIYDASVIGMLPEQCGMDGESVAGTEPHHHQSKRKRRSTRTKTDACAGTSEYSNGDGETEDSNSEKESSIATAVMRDLKLNPCSCTSTQFDATTVSKYAGTQASRDDVRRCGCECQTTEQPPQLPYLMMQASKPRLTRFQCFIQRIFGIRRDYRPYSPDGHIYAASDNNIMHTFGERRRRRGLRFRRLRRPKKTQSEVELRNVRSPMILNYVQSVQRSCLMDTTPRQCPITGCRMISYGIINYNDHLNLCHFSERKFVCHYCHEGFDNENDKHVHENEHLGITKLNLTATDSSARESTNKSSVTQTDPELTRCDVQEDKLKKIVSFFDKISDPDQVFSHMKKDRFSESNLRSNKMGSTPDNVTSTDLDNSTDGEGEKRTVSCVNLRRKIDRRLHSSTEESERTSKCSSPVCCNYCGECFDYRRQLSLHMDLEHRSHGKYSKFHSCAGIVSPKCPIHSSDTDDNLHRIATRTTLTESRVSEQTVTRDPSTNVVYTSVNPNKPSLSSFVGRGGYQWEPGTKIIRV
ncbi:uncharacterized protein LOC128681594 [Plodia interpunctella]|uniref:uncharacterized protein LOC128681594 n=1 Tax=Plodia interpunctella TaxID=58824 RepID=UPI002367E287|nr:uncharacterized protein LOC128681594 [Plodia interpunctella]